MNLRSGCLSFLVCFSVLLVCSLNGCSPSVRYTRGSKPTSENTRLSIPEGKLPAVSETELQQAVSSYLGAPYKYGGTSREGMDCSGFVYLVYKQVYEVSLPRSSGKMWRLGRIVPPKLAKPGDLIFFRSGFFNRINHVGIYMGDNRFVHASSTNGVIYSNMEDDYYSRRFAAIRRMF
ncbi:MAG: C40 family peptidase [Chitinispirillaceae bacterium]